MSKYEIPIPVANTMKIVGVTITPTGEDLTQEEVEAKMKQALDTPEKIPYNTFGLGAIANAIDRTPGIVSGSTTVTMGKMTARATIEPTTPMWELASMRAKEWAERQGMRPGVDVLLLDTGEKTYSSGHAHGSAHERAETLKRLRMVADDWDREGHVGTANAFRAHAFAVERES